MLKFHVLNDKICGHAHDAAHGTEIPPNARLLFCNGQVGARKDASVPSTTLEQVEVIFERIQTILAASGMTLDDVVKFTVFATDKVIFQDYFTVRGKLMGARNPPATLITCGPFPRPGVQVEIEAVAAKAA